MACKHPETAWRAKTKNEPDSLIAWAAFPNDKVSLNDALLLGSHNGLIDQARPYAACACRNFSYAAIGALMPYKLQIWLKTPLGLDIGMADKIPHLGFFSAKKTFLAHGFFS